MAPRTPFDNDEDRGAPLDPKDRLLREAKERFKRAQDWEGGWRKLYIDDVKFANGDSDNGWQWPDAVKEDRDANNRPCLTINKTKTIITKLANEAKKNPPEPRIKPVGDKVSYEAAQVWGELLRHVQYISNFQALAGQAKEAQLEGGLGVWEVIHDYVDEESFDQEIKFKPLDPMYVYLDCDIKTVDGADARWGFIFEEYNRKEFKKLFPGVGLPSMPRSPGLDDKDDWVRDDAVRVAQYYRIVLREDELIYIEDEEGQNWTGRLSEIPQRWRKQLDDYKTGKVGGDYKSREVKHRQLEWYRIMGSEILDSDKERAGSYIPIIRMPGRERKIENRLYRAGLVRAIKDPQRMYNYNALAVDTPLPTPTGWTTMADVQVGDWLLDEQGKPTQILSTSPVFVNRPCFMIEFDTGCSITADANHLWTVEERGKRRAATFDWTIRTIPTTELDPHKHLISVTEPFDLVNVALPVPPYVLGAWLGDGSSRGGVIHAGNQDVDAIHAELSKHWPNIGAPRLYRNATAAEIPLYGLSSRLSEIGVLGRKHIPGLYLRASRAQREQLLRGLMDTDGHIAKNRQCTFVNTKLELIDDVEQLARSLGLKISIEAIGAKARKFPSGKIFQCAESWYLRFTAPNGFKTFCLSRKAERQNGCSHDRRTKRHRIVSITPVNSEPTRCIQVSSPSALFLAGWGMVPTHNSSGEVEVVALQTKTPWVVAAAAIEGNETAWAKANTQNAAYLAFRHVDDEGGEIPPPQRAEGPKSAEGFLEGLRISAAEMELASGIQMAQQVNPSLERTPQAINQRTRDSEIVNYDFVANEMLAIRHTAVVFMDLAPHIYDTERVVQTMAKDGTIREIRISPDADEAYEQTGAGDEEGAIKVLFNPKVGKFAIEADVGPAYQTQREEAWNAFIEIIKAQPDLMQVMGDLGFRAGDFPLAQQIAERLKRNISHTMPWLLDDSQIGPLVQQLQQELAKSQQQNSELMERLADSRIKLKGKQELRDIEAMGADDNRLTAVVDALAKLHEMGINEHELFNLLRETEHTMAHDDASLEVEKANQPSLEEGPTETRSESESKGKTGTKKTTTHKIQHKVPRKPA